MASFKLPKTYDFKATEDRIYDWWEAEGLFQTHPTIPTSPDFDPQIKPFVISIPPPNVTGELHLGHAMFVSMEDLMIRYHRMKGIPTLWVPGTDHAGIATQLQVEKALAKEGRPASRSGAKTSCSAPGPGKRNTAASSPSRSAAWALPAIGTRERFTLDEGLSRPCEKPLCACTRKG